MPRQKELPLSPQQVVLLGFAAVILVGGLLLSLPIASNGQPLRLLDALFEATSAVCVTGLTVVDPATQFNLFGRIVMALLIQLGGLGFATFSTFSAVLIGRRIGLRERIILQQSLNQDALQGLVRLARLVFLVTMIIEGCGALVLTVGFSPQYGFWTALGYGAFHAVSAFNNAGFDLFGGFRSLGGQPVWLDVVLCVLVVLGGLGFTVIGELSRSLRPRRWSFHTKVVMATTAILLAAGTALIWLSEYTARSIFVGMPWYERGAQALFWSTSARTAGFATFDPSELGSATLLFVILLMFIGASPNSTGGGIKTTTFATLLMSMLSTLRGKRDVTLFRRRLPVEAIRRATAISLLAGMWIAGSLILLTLAEPAIDFIKLFFEVVSAFGTVGLSTGITPDLNPPARIVLMLTMFAGRIGLLTLLLALAGRETAEIRYPEAPISIG